ncbi:MAG: hypothetical protein WD716_10130, partial [Fimbriimonadaceae bacterium]
NTLMDKSDDFQTAKGWYDVMIRAGVVPSVVTYNTLMDKSDDFQTAKGWYDVMIREGVVPDVFTYSTLMNKAEDYSTAKGWHKVMVSDSILPSAHTFGTLFSKDLSQVDAEELITWFLSQPHHPPSSIDAMIKSFKRANQHDKVARVVLHYPYLQAARKVFREHPQLCIAYFESLLAVDPTHPNASYALGIALLESGRNQDALPHLQVALVQAEKREAGGKRGKHIRRLISNIRR